MACEECTRDELTAQQRAGMVIWFLARGHSFSTLEIAALTGLSRQGAWEMMNGLSPTLPLVLDHNRWKLIA